CRRRCSSYIAECSGDNFESFYFHACFFSYFFHSFDQDGAINQQIKNKNKHTQPNTSACSRVLDHVQAFSDRFVSHDSDYNNCDHTEKVDDTTKACWESSCRLFLS